ncbi:4Fe-4S dicluster domain-containing protein [Zhaonella formicivorans]|jgi:carbon-monoxide dehydrogenase iron sulfur subunit|uniref:4Fe-4S dicluster domain-containing protein n=1 Tax=Zhaonella formicivorans TaxID=2528593 RepID=UPI0010D67E02|nr:4Fe-4S dicluster domain-containing protein [Zhaonella formicivorans]
MKEIFVDLDKCVGCLTCTLACAAEHSNSKDIVGAMLEKVRSRIAVESVGGKPVPLMCRHCEEPACVDACMTGAMQKDKVTGIVTNEGHEQKCVGCWMCIMACPYGVITPVEGETRLALKCDRCGGKEVPACVASCPQGALIYDEAKVVAELRRHNAAQLAMSKAV